MHAVRAIEHSRAIHFSSSSSLQLAKPPYSCWADTGRLLSAPEGIPPRSGHYAPRDRLLLCRGASESVLVTHGCVDGVYLVFVACCPPDAVSLCRYTATGERQHNGTAYHAVSRHVLVFIPFCYCEKSPPQFNSKWFVPKKRASRFLKAFKEFLVLIPSIFRLDSSHSSGMPRSGQTPYV